MSLWETADGGLVSESPANALVGVYFAAVESEGDTSDLVVVRGFHSTAPPGHPEIQKLSLIVQSAEFGAIPPTWEYATETFDPDDFLAAYRRATPEELEALAQADDAKRAAADAAHAEAEERRQRANPIYAIAVKSPHA